MVGTVYLFAVDYSAVLDMKTVFTIRCCGLFCSPRRLL